MKDIIIILVTLFFSLFSFAQKTFHIDSTFLDTLEFKKYRTFVVSREFGINFISRPISKSGRFTLDKSEAIAVDQAIQTQYAKVVLQQLDKQYGNISAFTDTVEWRRAYETYQERRPKVIQREKNNQKYKIQKFDRYLWGYHNADNEKLVLIRFDPHKIRHYSIAGESFIDVLPIMVYNINTGQLSYSGWADFKE